MGKLNIYLDMDGTIADLYGVNDWLSLLHAENVAPYEQAKPLINMDELIKILADSRVESNIISWTCKDGSAKYNRKIRYAKLRWLKKYHLTNHISKYYIIDYGTPKSTVVHRPLSGSDILIDDEPNNQLEWLAAGGSVIGIKNLITELKKVLDFMG